MKRIIFIALAGVVICTLTIIGFSLRPDAAPQQWASMVVYKSPTCGCCVEWIKHMQKAGFNVEARDMRDMGSVKARLGVPSTVTSCHTSVIDGYVIEGHVPAPYVKELLEEKPELSGISVPGMPIGSPGMEGPNAQPYEIVTFHNKEVTGIFARVEP